MSHERKFFIATNFSCRRKQSQRSSTPNLTYSTFGQNFAKIVQKREWNFLLMEPKSTRRICPGMIRFWSQMRSCSTVFVLRLAGQSVKSNAVALFTTSAIIDCQQASLQTRCNREILCKSKFDATKMNSRKDSTLYKTLRKFGFGDGSVSYGASGKVLCGGAGATLGFLHSKSITTLLRFAIFIHLFIVEQVQNLTIKTRKNRKVFKSKNTKEVPDCPRIILTKTARSCLESIPDKEFSAPFLN